MVLRTEEMLYYKQRKFIEGFTKFQILFRRITSCIHSLHQYLGNDCTYMSNKFRFKFEISSKHDVKYVPPFRKWNFSFRSASCLRLYLNYWDTYKILKWSFIIKNCVSALIKEEMTLTSNGLKWDTRNLLDNIKWEESETKVE